MIPTNHRSPPWPAARKSALATMLGIILTFVPALAQPSKRPNILYIVADDMRQDTIAALGNPVIETPALDGLVRKGTVL